MNISELFSTKERVRLLEFIIYKIEYLNVSKVANELKLSKGLVSKFFDILVKERILKRTKNNFLVQDNINTKAIKVLLNLASFDTKIFNKHWFVKSAGLYGSFVKGTNIEDSDIDLWIVTERADEEDLAKLTNELKREYRNIRPLYLTKEKLKALRKEDTLFYYSLVFGSITVYGEEIETV
jgi:predicted nucleotidyltransferase